MLERDEQIAEIVAAVEDEPQGFAEERLETLEERMGALEQQLGVAQEQMQAAGERLAALELQVAALGEKACAPEVSAAAAAGRKTVQAGAVTTLAKQGISAAALEGLSRGRMEAGSLDTALASLSIEQRFAVKSEMLRAGLL